MTQPVGYPSPGDPQARVLDAAAPQTRRAREAERKRRAILTAGLELFSKFGLDGTTLERVADHADMSKTNLIYYYPSKDALYAAVLADVLSGWLVPFAAIGTQASPEQTIRRYIRAKMELSRDNAAASRLFCFEMLQGAPVIGRILREELRPLVEEKVKVIRRWIRQGWMAPVDPYQLIFSLWATTQHFADFAVQIDALCDRTLDDPAFFERSVDHVVQLFLTRIRPAGADAGAS